MITAITILSFLCLLFLLIKLEWGLGLYLLLLFLVPFYYLYLGGPIIGENLLSLIILVLLLFRSRKYGNLKLDKISLSILSPFLFLFLAQAILIPFHFSEMPFSDQFNRFRIDIMRLFLPFAILSVVSYDKSNAILFKNVLYLAIAVATSYGIFLISMPGQNPYIDAINSILGYDVQDQSRILDEGVRTFGYISSVHPHVTEYGYFLIFSSVFLLYQFKRDKTIIPKLLFGLVMVNVIICGSRSVLLAEGIVLFVYLCYNHQFKVLVIALVLLIVTWLVLKRFVPNYLLFLGSIGDESISGSSINGRWGQFQGCFEAIKVNPIFGLGYGWTGWFCYTFGHHPTMLSFESCLIQILCNNGIMGLVIWGTMVVFVFKKISRYFKGNVEFKKMISLLLLAYFAYTFFTGDYGTFRVMMIFYSLIVANEMCCQDANKKMERCDLLYSK